MAGTNDTNSTRLCLDCGTGLEGRGASAKRCKPCAAERHRQRRNALNRARAAKRPRNCGECGADIRARHPVATYCEPCAARRLAQAIAAAEERKAVKRKARLEERRRGRTCADCGTDISERSVRAQRCVPCADARFLKQCVEGNRRYREANRKKVNARWNERNRERLEDPEYREKRRAKDRASMRRRRQRPEVREAARQRAKEYQKRPEAKRRAREYSRQRRQSMSDEERAASNKRHAELARARRADPEYRKEHNAKAAARRQKRWREDPEYRARVNAKQPERHRRRRRRILQRLLAAQDWKCGDRARCDWKGCGRDLSEAQYGEVEVDHIIPASRGGSDDAANLQALCRECNMAARDFLPAGLEGLDRPPPVQPSKLQTWAG